MTSLVYRGACPPSEPYCIDCCMLWYDLRSGCYRCKIYPGQRVEGRRYGSEEDRQRRLDACLQQFLVFGEHVDGATQ